MHLLLCVLLFLFQCGSVYSVDYKCTLTEPCIKCVWYMKLLLFSLFDNLTFTWSDDTYLFSCLSPVCTIFKHGDTSAVHFHTSCTAVIHSLLKTADFPSCTIHPGICFRYVSDGSRTKEKKHQPWPFSFWRPLWWMCNLSQYPRIVERRARPVKRNSLLIYCTLCAVHYS